MFVLSILFIIPGDNRGTAVVELHKEGSGLGLVISGKKITASKSELPL